MLLFKATYSKKEKQKQFVTEPTLIVIYYARFIRQLNKKASKRRGQMQRTKIFFCVCESE